ncbi:MAG: inositol monophosphatase [Bacilli bacterium]|nr:inositol monophosphatase [Bacilli bacterium]
MDHDRVLDFLVSLYGEAKPRFLSLSPKTIKHKRANDILTDADVSMNGFFVEAIKKEYPEASIIAEESQNDQLGEGYTFVVDPIDGTCNYALGLPLCGIQIALVYKKEPVVALLGLPHFDELYTAVKGQGAFCNGQRLSIRKETKSEDAILALSDLYSDNEEVELRHQYAAMEFLRPFFLKTRLFGAAVVDFAYLATNKAQAYLCQYHLLWDIAPGLLLALEAGAVASDCRGKPYRLGRHTLCLANNQENLDLLLSALRLGDQPKKKGSRKVSTGGWDQW